MNIQEDILEEFFSELEDGETIPATSISHLREMWRQGRLGSKAELREAICKELEDAPDD
jgi:hypothetical protein